MNVLLLLLGTLLSNSVGGFFVRLPSTRSSKRFPAVVHHDRFRFNPFRLSAAKPGTHRRVVAPISDSLVDATAPAASDRSDTFRSDPAPLANLESGVNATALAHSKSASEYQITRPRWYNKAEVAIIFLLCQRLRMLDLKGVEHMLDAAPKFAKEDPRDVWQRALYLSRAAPGANFRVVIQRHPRRFPTASSKELVRIVESAPSLIRMSGANGTLSIKVDHLMTLLPGVNVTNVISNAPGVLIRGVASLPSKVKKLKELFPSANVTKMVSRTPGIMYLDIDRTVGSKARWIQEVVGLDQEGLDSLVEQGPWLLKAGWGRWRGWSSG